MSEQWIVVRNWDRFQHYRNRHPPWIKVYNELLDDPNYLALTPAARAVLQGVWLQYSRSLRAVPKSTLWLSRALHMKVSSAHLKALNDAGFIDFSASKPLAPRYHDASATRAGEEVEEEKEKERTYEKLSAKSSDEEEPFDFDKVKSLLQDMP